MFNTTRATSLPAVSKCYQAGVLAEHFKRNQIEVELEGGERVKTGHICADGRAFDFRDVYDNSEDWTYIYFRQFSYTDEAGQTQIVDVKPRSPHVIIKDSETRHAYTTKINGKRWGVMIVLNWKTGRCQILPDEGSPITGCLFQFI